MNPKIQAFAIKISTEITFAIENVMENYKKDPKEGLQSYFSFVVEIKPSLKKIVANLRIPFSVGEMSPRLLRDPRSIELNSNDRSKEEIETRKKELETQIKIAKRDYQLYEALMMLEGLNAARTRGNNN